MRGAAGLAGGVPAGARRARRIAGCRGRAGDFADQPGAGVEIAGAEQAGDRFGDEGRIAEVTLAVGIGEAHGLAHLEPGLGVAGAALVDIGAGQQAQHLQQGRAARG